MCLFEVNHLRSDKPLYEQGCILLPHLAGLGSLWASYTSSRRLYLVSVNWLLCYVPFMELFVGP